MSWVQISKEISNFEVVDIIQNVNDKFLAKIADRTKKMLQIQNFKFYIILFPI